VSFGELFTDDDSARRELKGRLCINESTRETIDVNYAERLAAILMCGGFSIASRTRCRGDSWFGQQDSCRPHRGPHCGPHRGCDWHVADGLKFCESSTNGGKCILNDNRLLG